jgi:hypothetical protein
VNKFDDIKVCDKCLSRAVELRQLEGTVKALADVKIADFERICAACGHHNGFALLTADKELS